MARVKRWPFSDNDYVLETEMDARDAGVAMYEV